MAGATEASAGLRASGFEQVFTFDHKQGMRCAALTLNFPRGRVTPVWSLSSPFCLMSNQSPGQARAFIPPMLSASSSSSLLETPWGDQITPEGLSMKQSFPLLAIRGV